MCYEEILQFWFGQVEETVVPAEIQARIWFGESKTMDQDIKSRFSEVLQTAIAGGYPTWVESPRGRLALIIVLDQFSRHIYRDQAEALAQDAKALTICYQGILQQADHQLSLIERVFYYFPLLHSENLMYQELSMQYYQMLLDLAFPETKIIYDNFLKFAQRHCLIIRQFGRFPQRNQVLSRKSTAEEMTYLKELEG